MNEFYSKLSDQFCRNVITQKVKRKNNLRGKLENFSPNVYICNLLATDLNIYLTHS